MIAHLNTEHQGIAKTTLPLAAKGCINWRVAELDIGNWKDGSAHASHSHGNVAAQRKQM
jgi:hypothetical protein